MKALPDKEGAIATLKEFGYVRLGDHSATTIEQLEEIYSTRHKAWEEAEKAGFLHLGDPAPAPNLPVAPAAKK